MALMANTRSRSASWLERCRHEHSNDPAANHSFPRRAQLVTQGHRRPRDVRRRQPTCGCADLHAGHHGCGCRGGCACVVAGMSAPLSAEARNADIERRLNERSIPVPGPGCWIWIGRTSTNGYGRIGIGRNKQYAAHRVSWEHYRGPIPAGMIVCHKCDTPLCINPNHLFIGTHADNARDRDRKGRAGHGHNGGGWNRGIPHSISHPNGSLGRRASVGGAK